MSAWIILAIIAAILWFIGGIIEKMMLNGISSGHPIIPEPNNLLASLEEE